MTDLSIVVVSLVGGDALINHLESLTDVPGECLVLVDGTKNNIMNMQKQFPSMHFIERNNMTVPMARKHGVELSTGGIVALLEDTSLPTSGWYDAISAAFSGAEVLAVGGPVVLSPKLGGRFLALGCGEYGRFHPDRYTQLVDGLSDEQVDNEAHKNGMLPVTRLSGNNLAYRSDQLLKYLAGSEQGLIEGQINELLKADGYKLYMHPTMSVTYAMMDKHGARLNTRFNHGRLYAGNQIACKGMSRRIICFMKSMILPVVLTVRGWSSMTSAVESVSWPKVMVWIFLMETAWSIGEAVGYLKGAGRSLEAWR